MRHQLIFAAFSILLGIPGSARAEIDTTDFSAAPLDALMQESEQELRRLSTAVHGDKSDAVRISSNRFSALMTTIPKRISIDDLQQRQRAENLAMNVATLGEQLRIAAAAGRDEESEQLVEIMNRRYRDLKGELRGRARDDRPASSAPSQPHRATNYLTSQRYFAPPTQRLPCEWI